MKKTLKMFLNFPLLRRFFILKTRKVSIRRRIIRVVMASCIVTLLICLFFSFLVIVVERGLFVKNGREIGEFTTEVSSDAILQQSVTQSCDYIIAKSDLLNAYLLDIQNKLVMIGDFITDVYHSPQSFVPVNVPHRTQVAANVYSDHWYLDFGVTMNSSLRRELGLLGNIKYPVKSMITQHKEIQSMYVVTATGINIDFDDQGSEKESVMDPKASSRGRPWFILAEQRGKISITDIYEDNAGRGYCFTFCTPFYSKDGRLAGVIGADISMVELSKIIEQITGNDIELAMLIGSEGVLANSLHKNIAIDGEMNRLFTEIMQKDRGAIKKEIPDFTAEKPTIHEAYIIWASLPLTDWKLVGFAPISSIVAPADKIKLNISLYTDRFIHKAILYVDVIQIVNILVFSLLIAIFIFYSRKTANRIVTPITALTDDALKIGQGTLEFLPKIDTGDEIETLTNTINKMIFDIKYITSEKERIGVELEVAKHVQASMLPNIFPPFPHRPEFDIYGFMLPAKEVGGDFYDFFFVDEHRLALVIADVSGKGVPASLFMVITKTLIKNVAQYASSPKEVFETVNNMLCENNDMGMFVTAFLGILDLQTEMLTYVNAGHNPPFKRHINGTLEQLQSKTTLVLAAMTDTKYIQNEISLKKGEILYFYTDGVVEAVNNNEQMFTEKRLKETIANYPSNDPKGIADNLIHEIDVFTEGVEQADDITMLVLRVN